MIAMSDGREYEAIFRYSPVPLWVEDISQLRAELNDLRSAGVSDIDQYLAEHPELVLKAAELIQVVDVNDAVLRLYGVKSRDELIGPVSTTLDLADRKTLASLSQDIVAIFEGRTYVSRESSAVRPGGGRMDIVLYSQLSSEAGMSAYMLVSVIDVTEQRRAERELRQSEERFRSVVEASVQPIVNIDAAGRIIFWNNAAWELLGYTVMEVLGRPAESVLPAAMIAQTTGRTASGSSRIGGRAGATPLEAVAAAKDGHPIQVEFTVAAWNTETETCHTVIIRDITERKAANEKLKQQAKLLDIASDAIIVVDTERKIRYWNKSAERMFGWSAEEALGRIQNDLFCSTQHEGELRNAQRTTFASGQWSGESHYSTKDGRVLTGETRMTLVSDDDGEPTGILAVTTDTSERKELEQELRRYQRLDSIGTLAGGVAHDLNNVLTPIVNGVESLTADVTGESAKRMLSIIRGSALRGAAIVRQLLDFARGMEGERAIVDVAETIEDIKAIVEETFPKSIRFRSEIAHGVAPIQGEPTQIHQVLMNLCVNARDAMPRGGTLTVKARNEVLDQSFARVHVEANPGPYVVLDVDDTGTGMGPTVLERAFDPFFTTKETGKGTGLGLSTSLSIVRSHGGFMTISSTPGSGTCFRVYLPAANHETIRAERKESAQPAGGSGELILIADDEEAVSQTTRRILESHGYKVATTADGAELVAEFEKLRGSVRLIITDMVMPNVDGLAAIRAIRKTDADVPIVVTTGLNDGRDVRRLEELGVFSTIPKPFTIASLLQTISVALSAAKGDHH